jgi:hypothetical protein
MRIILNYGKIGAWKQAVQEKAKLVDMVNQWRAEWGTLSTNWSADDDSRQIGRGRGEPGATGAA